MRHVDVGDADLLLSQQHCAWADRFPCAFPRLGFALEEAVAVVEDKSRYEAIAAACVRSVQKTYGWDRHAHTIVRAVFGVEKPGFALAPAIA